MYVSCCHCQGAVGVIIIDDGQCVAYDQHCLPGADKQRGEGFARLGMLARPLYILLMHFTCSMHPINTPSQYTLSIHPINTPSQCTLSIHPSNTPSQYTLSMHPSNTPYQCTLAIHPLNELSHISSECIPNRPYQRCLSYPLSHLLNIF